MLCEWVRIGPHFTVLLVAIALIVSPTRSTFLCQHRTICHVCI